MLLSVIVPVYNMERFLPRCFESLLHQGMGIGENGKAPDYEIICVDDGSTDQSSAILADYARQYPELIRVIRQENQGLGPARNTGMDAAKGEYIGFVDSDDYLVENGLGYICNRFLDEKPDVLTYMCRILHSEAEEPKTLAKPDGKIVMEGKGRDVYQRLHPTAVWTRIYKRSFLQEHHVKFEPIFMEDEVFNLYVFSKNPTVRVVDSNIYRYMWDNQNSLTRVRKKNKVLQKLDDCVYGMGVFNTFLIEEGNKSVMADGIKDKIDGFLEVYYRELFGVQLTFKEWTQVTRKKNKLPIHSFSRGKKRSMLGKHITMMKNLSGRYYWAYLTFGFVHHNIFEKYLRNKIVGG